MKLAFLVLLALQSCRPKPAVSPTIPSHSAAVLPLSNQSIYVVAPEYVRKVFQEALKRKGYPVYPSPKADELLRTELGITDGAQLKIADPQKIGLVLGAETLVYGEILDFSDQSLGVYESRSVHIRFRMVDAKTGGVIWRDEKKVSERRLAKDSYDAAESFILWIFRRLFENMLKSPLRRQVENAVEQMAYSIPRR